MANIFLEHIDHWLPQVLREKAIGSAQEDRLVYVGATDFSEMVADYVLNELAALPTCCETGCDVDFVSNETLTEATGFGRELLAAGFFGAVVNLVPWQGKGAIDFLTVNGVPRDYAVEFVTAVEMVAEKLGRRGHALVQQLDEARAASSSAVEHHTIAPVPSGA